MSHADSGKESTQNKKKGSPKTIPFLSHAAPEKRSNEVTSPHQPPQKTPFNIGNITKMHQLFSCHKFGYQAHRLKLGMPSLMSRVLGKIFALSGFYGSELDHFNRKMLSPLQWPVRMLHQPLEILVGATKT